MKASGPVAVSTLLGQAGGLRRLAERAGTLQELERALAPALPGDLRRHCRLANIHEGVVVMVADSPVWAARLKFAGPALLGLLRRDHGLSARRLRVRIAPASVPAAGVVRHHSLPDAAGRALRSLAERESDPGLAAALRRLGSRARRAGDAPPPGIRPERGS